MAKKVVLFFFLLLFLFSCRLQNIESTGGIFKVKIGKKIDYKKFEYNFSCAPAVTSFTVNDYMMKKYSFFGEKKIGNIVICVDENEIIRSVSLSPSNIFSDDNEFHTPEGYNFYSNWEDVKMEDIDKIFDQNGKIVKLKSGWCMNFTTKHFMNDLIKERCNFYKIDEIFFQYIDYGFERGLIGKDINDENYKKIREFIKKEGIPYG